MKYLPLFLLTLAVTTPVVLVSSAEDDDIKTDEGVLVLTKDNYQSALDKNQYVLVEFYAPWCGHCKALAPEYAKAAQKLAEAGSDIKLAKVDATEEGSLAEENGVRGYPTLKFYRNGKAIDYSGGRTADEIVTWVQKKTGPAATTVGTKEEVEKFKEGRQVAVVGFFESADSPAAKAFLSVADGMDDVQFVMVVDAGVAKEFDVKGEAVHVYKKFDDGLATLTDSSLLSSSDSIQKFIKTESLPLIIDFNHDTAQKVFGGDIKSHVLLFLSKSSNHYDKYLPNHRDLAKTYRDRLLFVSINTDDEDHGRILEFFGMKKEEVPAARLIKLADEMAKYKPDEGKDVLGSGEEMGKWVEEFLKGGLKQHLLSQEIPEDWDKGPVKVLVAKNFDEVAFDKEKSVLVEFYAPWCGHCKQLAPTYEKLGEKFASDSSIVIAKMDSTVNELEHTKINSFPTIKLYKKGDNTVVDYNGERTLEGLTKFVETDGSYGGGKGEGEEEEDGDDDEGGRKDEL